MPQKDNKNDKKPSGFLDWFRNATLGAAMAEAPAIMTASGWRLNEKGDYVLDLQDKPEIKLLRSNLVDIGVNGVVDAVGFPAVYGLYRYGLKTAGKAGSKWARAKLISEAIDESTSAVNSLPANVNLYDDNSSIQRFQGSDEELLNLGEWVRQKVLEHYNSPEKVRQIKQEMRWGDTEISELQDEINDILNSGYTLLIKGYSDGFKPIGLHNFLNKTITLNRDRVPNIEKATETFAHEFGGHARTASIHPEYLGIGGPSDIRANKYPRLMLLMSRNSEIADYLLELNPKGRKLSQFRNDLDIERFFLKKNIPWEKFLDFKQGVKHFWYVNGTLEKVARGYVGQFMPRFLNSTKKPDNIKQLEQFYTPESVELFKDAVLGVTPVVAATSLIPSDKNGAKIVIKKENKGLFTKYCNGKVTNECILKGKNSPDPKIRKRAIFADNVINKFKK